MSVSYTTQLNIMIVILRLRWQHTRTTWWNILRPITCIRVMQMIISVNPEGDMAVSIIATAAGAGRSRNLLAPQLSRKWDVRPDFIELRSFFEMSRHTAWGGFCLVNQAFSIGLEFARWEKSIFLHFVCIGLALFLPLQWFFLKIDLA